MNILLWKEDFPSDVMNLFLAGGGMATVISAEVGELTCARLPMPIRTFQNEIAVNSTVRLSLLANYCLYPRHTYTPSPANNPFDIGDHQNPQCQQREICDSAFT